VKFILSLFLQHLLAKLSVLLFNDEDANPWRLVVKAGSLKKSQWRHH
jgi:hypothetical protein